MKPVLLVDDSPTILAAIGGLLGRAGVPVQQAACAEEALDLLCGSGPALRLIITDYHMPGMTGVELVRQARRLSRYRFTPILLLTTESEQGLRDEARAAGATGWLVKPVEPTQLLAVLDQVAPA